MVRGAPRFSLDTTRAIIVLLLLACQGLLYQVKREDPCPPEEVEFICSNNINVPVVQWTITSLLSGFQQSIAFHVSFDRPVISRFTTIDNYMANATFLFSNTSWYLTSLIIPSALSLNIQCNFDFVSYHSSNGKKHCELEVREQISYNVFSISIV